MKNYVIPLMLIVLTNNFVSSQVPFYDAMELAKHVDNSNGRINNDSTVYTILDNYVEPHVTNTDPYKIEDAFNNIPDGDPNPFIEISSGGGESVDGYLSKSALISSVGGLDVTKYAEGLAQFMINRAQAELTLAFFDKFKDFVTNNPEAKMLFPKTCDRLENLLTVHYRQMLNVLREAFKEDLEKLPDNILDLLEDIAKRESLPEFQIVVKTMKQVRKLEYLSASEFIDQLPTITKEVDMADNDGIKNLDNTLKLVQILSNSIRDTSENRNWVSSSDYHKNIINDETTRKIYFGLLYQQIKNDSIKFNNELLINHLQPDMLKKWNEKLSELIHLVNKVDGAVSEIKTANNEESKITHGQIHEYITTTLDIIEFGHSVYKEFHSNSTDEKFKTYLGYVSDANAIYKYVYEEQYGSAVMELVNLLKSVEKDKNFALSVIEKAPKKYLEANTGVKVKDDAPLTTKQKNDVELLLSETEIDDDKIKKNVKKAREHLDSTFKWIDKLSTYGVFIANMVEAETADEAMAVIEAAALPVGSSVLKKQSAFTVGLNGYLGLNMAFRDQQFLSDVSASRYTLTAPVGVEFSWGRLGKKDKAGSVSALISILDIGAIVDYQLSDDSTRIESKITLGNTLSPGVYFMYGFFNNLPLSLGVGIQYGPGLTAIAEDRSSIVNKPYWRFGATLAVDLPIVYFSNRQGKK